MAAPAGSGLDCEAESYFITRALHDHVGVIVNEMGEVGDLIAGLRSDPAPVGVHFSGHGGPGALVFEDEVGGAATVPVTTLLERIRKAAPQRFPRFFYLKACARSPRTQLCASLGERLILRHSAVASSLE